MDKNKRLFITYKDVKMLHDLQSNSSVFYNINKAKKALNKKKKAKITVVEYCAFIGITEEQFYEKIK